MAKLGKADGARIGIVGATTPGSMVWDRDNLKGRVIVRDVIPDLKTAVAEESSTVEYLKELSAMNPGFTWTGIATKPFRPRSANIESNPKSCAA